MLRNLNNYQVLLWDFDGVLMNSNSTRDLGFETVLNTYPPDQVNELLEFHRKNGGLSRYVKFQYFFEKIRKEKVDQKVLKELLFDFSTIMLKSLLDDKLLIEETIEYIDKNYKNKKMFIVSGSDQIELRKICQALKIENYFISIFGSPESKSDIIYNIIKINNYEKNNCVMIGDSINDYDASVLNGISFLGYNNPFVENLTNI